MTVQYISLDQESRYSRVIILIPASYILAVVITDINLGKNCHCQRLSQGQIQ